MTLSLIAAMDRKRGIGAGDKIPWRLSAETHFLSFALLASAIGRCSGALDVASIGAPSALLRAFFKSFLHGLEVRISLSFRLS